MDIEEIKKWHKIFYPEGGLFEIRLLHGIKNRNWSGYFKDVDVMIKALQPILEHPQYNGNPQVYFTLNEIPEALYSREQHDRFVIGAATTTDSDIKRRKFVLLDFDPQRPANISSSQEELAKAKEKAGKVYKYLKTKGFKEPVIALSGNGYHLLYRVDMPNDTDHNELIKMFVESLYQTFPGNGVDIDCKVFNAARICKLYGTEAKKGTSTASRPWRTAKILYAPEKIEINNNELFSSIALSMPKLQPQTLTASLAHSTYDGEKFDLENWLREHGLEYRIKQNGIFTIYQLRKCPWEDSHSSHHDWDSAIFKRNDGQLSFSCWHDHCKGKTWKDVRLLYEPDAYSHQYEQKKNIVHTPKPRFEYKPETEDKGHKWLSLSQIQRVDWDSLEKVSTGFDEIDKSMMGLFMGDVTLLSGSNGSGKSSWLNTLILNVISNQYKVALWSGELQASDLKMWIEQVAAGPNHVKQSVKHPGFYYCPKDIGEKIDTWLDKKFAVYNSEYGAQWEQIFKDMQALRQKDVRFFVVDNLMALDIDLLDGDRMQQQKKVIIDIKQFAKESQSHVILVAHPRKSLGRGKFSLLRKDDIAGSSDLSNAVDNVFIIHRKNEDFLKGIKDFFGTARSDEFRNTDYGNFIEICKSRRFGIMDKFIGLYYEIKSRRFSSQAYDPNIGYIKPEVKRYPWEGVPVTQELPLDTIQQIDDDPLNPNGIEEFNDGNLPF